MLDVDHLTVRYGPIVAVEGLSLDAERGEVLAVIGPSGCGKSTLLRAIAGLVPTEGGTIHLDGSRLDPLRPDQRSVGLMFQDHALFPHRTVGDNVGFGPRMQGQPRQEVAERAQQALELVGLQGTEDRPVTQLSGGEQQRVALARAIAPRPRLLMLDEPLGSLDRALRDRLLEDLPDVFARTGTTVLYVTHDQDEALALADRIAVMNDGRLEQVDEPSELWRAPTSEFVARFLGLDHIFDAEVHAGVARTALGRLPVPSSATSGRVRLVLRRDALRLIADGDALADHEVPVHGTVRRRRFAGDHVRVEVATRSGVDLGVTVWRGPEVRVGDEVVVAVDPRAIHVLG